MNILLAFAPFLTFALLQDRLGTSDALLAAAILSALLIARDALIRHRSLKLLEIGSLLLFGGLSLACRVLSFNPSVMAVRLWVDAGILAIVAASLLIGQPFTVQYAREQVTPEIAATARFRTINLQLSLAWGAAFAVNVAADAAMLYARGFTPEMGMGVGLAALAGAALLTAWLPKAARARAA